MSDVLFKVSSALKNIIGKDLITDDFIAVFEIVKNSFDAHAKKVDIFFECLTTPRSKIIIKDDGDGMDIDDIENKWLFVAYSAKKEQLDYRDKITPRRIYAGAKGIGRFSCDKLGEKLRLYSRKKGQHEPWHVLDIHWNRFEIDPQKEFQNIPTEYSTMNVIPYKASHGTILEISSLRKENDEIIWDRNKLIRLRRSLERLINPNQENDAANFQINLHCEEELGKDNKIINDAKAKGDKPASWQLVNGPIKNFLFENLDLKTVRISLDVSSDGKTIRTELKDRGRRVYTMVEKNPYYKELHDIRIVLFALNKSAKDTFTKYMGIRASDYGSIFLYKNGFRIHPFGNSNDDKLGIDRRHQYGIFRTLGTRDLSGRIEINGLNPQFQETSSRDGGLLADKAFSNLRDLLIDFALKRLERFFIDLARFGTDTGELPDETTMSGKEIKKAIFDIIQKLTDSQQVISIDYDKDFLNILENSSVESVTALLKNLKRIASQQNSPVIIQEISKAEKQLIKLSKAKADAEAAEARERKKAKKAEAEAKKAQEKALKAEEAAKRAYIASHEAQYREKKLDTQNIFLKSILSKDMEHVLALHHSIGQDVLTIEQHINNLLSQLREGTYPSLEELKTSLERISLVAKKIGSISRFATQANHLAAQEDISSDLIEYIREYLLNIYGGIVADPYRNIIPIHYHQSDGVTFKTRFAPIDISIIFDNLLANSRKHKTRNIDVSIIEVTPDKLVISFADDGTGIPRRNYSFLFNIGFTTTDGSGLGLHHIKETITEMGGSIIVNEEKKTGTEFILMFPRKK
ncbi:MAG: ATP-binding protein [Verrucomicrobiales bacterium]|jgi:signal transduction histidine kinase|nr:ATP-binding protein [Verrucomicrobiales bacterium]